MRNLKMNFTMFSRLSQAKRERFKKTGEKTIAEFHGELIRILSHGWRNSKKKIVFGMNFCQFCIFIFGEVRSIIVPYNDQN